MKRDAQGYIVLTPKLKHPRLKRIKEDNQSEWMEYRAAYGSKFFSPALQRIVDLRRNENR